MFGLKKEQIMAIFIVIIMIGSIVGIAVWSTEGRETETSSPNPIIPPTNSITFTAENVPAKIINIFNYMIITGNTNEFEINKIDSELKSVNGIKQIVSRFAGNPADSIGSDLTYVAEITFSEKTALELLEEINAKSVSLQNIQGIITGSVNIPKNITLINKDLNLTKEHEFSETLTQALLHPYSIEGDDLLVSIEVNLNNKIVLSQNAFEEKNLTAEPIPVFVEQEMDLNELKPELNLSALIKKSSYENEIKVNELIESISGITEFETIIAKEENKIKFYFNELNENEVNSLTEFFEEKKIVINSDLNKKIIEIELNENYSELFLIVKEKINDTEFDLNKIEEANILFNSNIIIDGDSKTISQELINLFEENGFEIQLKQKALFFTEKITNTEDENFEVTEPFQALITPGTTEKINLEIFFYGIRGKAEYIQAEEKIKEE
jgi:hypothetical protein